MEEVSGGVLYCRIQDDYRGAVEQLVVPEKLHESVKKALHNDPGDFGFERTVQMIRERFCWPRMFQDIKAW